MSTKTQFDQFIGSKIVKSEIVRIKSKPKCDVIGKNCSELAMYGFLSFS